MFEARGSILQGLIATSLLLYFLLNDQTDQLKQSFQEKALRVIMNRIIGSSQTSGQITKDGMATN